MGKEWREEKRQIENVNSWNPSMKEIKAERWVSRISDDNILLDFHKVLLRRNEEFKGITNALFHAQSLNRKFKMI